MTDKKMMKMALKHLDYSRIKKVMEFLDWKWFNVGIPSEEDIKSSAKRLLKMARQEAYEKGESMHVISGGLKASCYMEEGDIIGYAIAFVVCESNSFDYEH